MDASARNFADQLKAKAAELGFELRGITAATTPNRLGAFHAWLEAGFHGTMEYLETRREAYSHPRHVLEGCRSILMLGIPYWHRDLESKRGALPAGKVARYASGEADYHDVIHAKLKSLKRWVLEQTPETQVRGVVDTAPLLEREFGELAGLGWTGKNTLLLNREYGSYFFLAALLLDCELPPDDAYPKSFCGTCTACLDHCPTDAFPSPFVLDASKCISYLTIEHRDLIENEIAERFDGWLFGCDVCQEVCPWNRKVTPTTNEITASEIPPLEATDLLMLDKDAFRQRFRKTPFWRPRRRGMLRNALLSLATSEYELTEDHKSRCVDLLRDEEPLVRMAAGWLLKQKNLIDWQTALHTAMKQENVPEVRDYLRGLVEDNARDEA
ncbi:MAG: tRNA epoxyqueuosine(34) reductase QueG [Aureliella sp.]